MYLRRLSRAALYPLQNAITRQSGRVTATAQVSDDSLCVSHFELESDDGGALILTEAGEDFVGDTEVGLAPREGLVRIRKGQADRAEFPRTDLGCGHDPFLHLSGPSFRRRAGELASGDRFCFAIGTRCRGGANR